MATHSNPSGSTGGIPGACFDVTIQEDDPRRVYLPLLRPTFEVVIATTLWGTLVLRRRRVRRGESFLTDSVLLPHYHRMLAMAPVIQSIHLVASVLRQFGSHSEPASRRRCLCTSVGARIRRGGAVVEWRVWQCC